MAKTRLCRGTDQEHIQFDKGALMFLFFRPFAPYVLNFTAVTTDICITAVTTEDICDYKQAL